MDTKLRDYSTCKKRRTPKLYDYSLCQKKENSFCQKKELQSLSKERVTVSVKRKSYSLCQKMDTKLKDYIICQKKDTKLKSSVSVKRKKYSLCHKMDTKLKSYSLCQKKEWKYMSKDGHKTKGLQSPSKDWHETQWITVSVKRKIYSLCQHIELQSKLYITLFYTIFVLYI